MNEGMDEHLAHHAIHAIDEGGGFNTLVELYPATLIAEASPRCSSDSAGAMQRKQKILLFCLFVC
jgi:hypothetical protein